MSPGELSDHWGDSDDDADLLASAEVAERNEKYISVAQSNTEEKEGEEENVEEQTRRELWELIESFLGCVM